MVGRKLKIKTIIFHQSVIGGGGGILCAQMQKKAEKANYYSKFLGSIRDVTIPAIAPNSTHIFHQYAIRIKNRDQFRKYLEGNSIPTMTYYPFPLHLQPAFSYLNYKQGDFPEAEKAAKEVLSLPIYPKLKKKGQDYIIAKIKEFYER